MEVGRTTVYAILAACHIAEHPEKETVLSQDIAKKYDILVEYLLKVLQDLVRCNILRSKRGPQGGYSLARPANKITMLQIIEAVDGPFVNYMSLAEQAKGAKFGVRADKVIDKVFSQAREVYKKTKLSDLIEGK